MFGWSWSVTIVERLINTAINLPIRIIVYFLTIKALKRPFEKIFKVDQKVNFAMYANSFQNITSPGLERISLLCKKLGHPERKLNYIHIAGTNGKGSVSAYTASILEAAGYTVGKFISPNLIDVNERISINGKNISNSDLASVLSRIEPLSKEVAAELGAEPTQFEIWTAAAFIYFDMKHCDYVVLEVGLGGELDATNIIKNNEIAIITRLGLDHTQYLGDTIADIAKAKAGIIKHRSETHAVVTVAQEDEAMKVINSACASHDVECIVADPVSIGNDGIYERFSVYGIENLKCGIAGYHQIENASLAVIAAKKLGIREADIRKGIENATHPARFELLSNDPMVIYDGGHNENGLEALVFSLERYFGQCDKVVLFACMRDKEIRGSLRLLGKGNTEFIYTTVKDNPRAASAEELLVKARSLGYNGAAYDDIADAYEDAVSRGKMVIICGSLYLYRDVRTYLDKRNKK
jgi:dihydrofolate synthase/folylpolyglutamate synthase